MNTCFRYTYQVFCLTVALVLIASCKRSQTAEPSEHVQSATPASHMPQATKSESVSTASKSEPALEKETTVEVAAEPTVVLEPAGKPAVQVKVEVADTPQTREQGLMFRKSLDQNRGMLFVFDRATQQVFWMRNTFIPLDMIFIGRDLRVVGSVENAAPHTESQRKVSGVSQYVLEVNAGFVQKHGIGVGTRVRWKDIRSELLQQIQEHKIETLVMEPTTPDPLKGKFNLRAATQGLPPKGQRSAEIKTSLGILTCVLDAKRAPNTVANFVGLARGKRPWWDPKTAAWVRRPLYDGTSFHRVIPGFMIQGGDALGDGSGGVGYVIADEVHPELKHDRGGQLCMANRGPNTNGGQFFITEDAAPHLDNGYTIFGQCEPVSLVAKIAQVPQADGSSNRPLQPVLIESVVIH